VNTLVFAKLNHVAQTAPCCKALLTTIHCLKAMSTGLFRSVKSLLLDWLVEVMNEFCISPLEKSRKAHSLLLQAMQSDAKQSAIATYMGVDDSTISRLKNTHSQGVLTMLYYAGLKVVPQAMQCYPAADVEAWYAAYRRQVTNAETAAQLFKGDE
jgi:hypothetical protein